MCVCVCTSICVCACVVRCTHSVPDTPLCLATPQKDDEIRAAAFRLFGALHRFGDGISKDSFFEQLFNNLPSLVLHANDDNNEVKKVRIFFFLNPTNPT